MTKIHSKQIEYIDEWFERRQNLNIKDYKILKKHGYEAAK